MVLRWSGHGGRSVGRLRLPGGAVFDQPVNLADVIEAAQEEAPAADADWS